MAANQNRKYKDTCMKIMTFNTQHCLNYLEQKIDYEIMARTITDAKADICGLNEMFDIGKDGKYGSQTKKLSELTDMPYYYFAKAIDEDGYGAYGNGLISKIPFKSVETIMIPDPDPKTTEGGFYETRCILKAELENGYTVLVTHFGLCPDEQKNAVKTVISHVSAEKCILMGDFNITPDDPLLIPLREKMKDAGELFGNKKLSWPSDKPRMKIDYIFVSPDIELLCADIPDITASDHRPHTAEIKG